VEPNLRARLRAGDPDAFGVLFDEYAHAVYNLGFRLTADWSAAEEVVSLTFLQAWRLRDRIDPGGEPLRPWLLGIAANMSRNLARASRRHQAALSRLPPPPLVPDFAEELAGRLDDQARLREAGKALGALRRGERDVIALCVWAGSYLGWLPALDLHPSAGRQPAPRNAAVIVAHLIWGAAAGALISSLRRGPDRRAT